MPPDPRVHVGVAGIIHRGKTIALLKRAGKEGIAVHGAGTWSVPGGWIDFGESPEEAVVREVFEEVGVVLSRDPLFAGYVATTWDNANQFNFHVVTMFFHCYALTSEKLQNMEPDKCDGVGWRNVEQIAFLARRHELFDPLQQFIDKYGWFAPRGLFYAP